MVDDPFVCGNFCVLLKVLLLWAAIYIISRLIRVSCSILHLVREILMISCRVLEFLGGVLHLFCRILLFCSFFDIIYQALAEAHDLQYV